RRGRDVAVPGRLAHRRAVHEVPPGRGHRHRHRDARVPRRQGHQHRRRAAHQDQDRPRVLQRRVARRRHVTTAVRVEKRKWDGTVSAVDVAERLPSTHGAVAWYVPAGASRPHPSKGTVDEVAADEVWAAVPGEWWVLCARIGPDRTVDEYVLHA